MTWEGDCTGGDRSQPYRSATVLRECLHEIAASLRSSQ